MTIAPRGYRPSSVLMTLTNYHDQQFVFYFQTCFISVLTDLFQFSSVVSSREISLDHESQLLFLLRRGDLRVGVFL